jgi:hypothetical protein
MFRFVMVGIFEYCKNLHKGRKVVTRRGAEVSIGKLKVYAVFTRARHVPASTSHKVSEHHFLLSATVYAVYWQQSLSAPFRGDKGPS